MKQLTYDFVHFTTFLSGENIWDTCVTPVIKSLRSAQSSCNCVIVWHYNACHCIVSLCHKVILSSFICFQLCFGLTNWLKLTGNILTVVLRRQMCCILLPWLQCSEYSAFHCTVSWNNVYMRQMEFQETKHLYFFISEMHRYYALHNKIRFAVDAI